MGLGLSGAYRAAGMQGELRKIEQEKIDAAKVEADAQQRQFLNNLQLRSAAIQDSQEGRAGEQFTRLTMPEGLTRIDQAKTNLEQDRMLFGQQQHDYGDTQTEIGKLSPTARTLYRLGTKPTFGDVASPEEQVTRSALEGTAKGAGAAAAWAGGEQQINTAKTNEDIRQANATYHPPASVLNGQKPTGAQRLVLDYYNRMRQALDNLDASESSLTSRDVAIIQNAPPTGIIANIASLGLSPAGQKYMQAARSYTLAKLRRESGAAISPGEFAQETAAALRNTNDTPETLTQKRQAREMVAQGFAQQSGSAYDEHYGHPFEAGGGTVPPQVLRAGPGRHTFANGQTWVVAADGKTARQEQ